MLSIAIGIVLSVWLLDITTRKLLAGRPVDFFGFAATAHTGSKIGANLAGFVSYLCLANSNHTATGV